MALKPQLLDATVMHKRLLPTENSFSYGVYYLALPLSTLGDTTKPNGLALNKKALISFFERDHGPKDGTSNALWIRKILTEYALNDVTEEIVLLAMPRVMNYVFNPVSFWLCFDDKQQLRAVLCEVNNTFGETHSYLCAHPDLRVIGQKDWLSAQKVFHVSPFLERNGKYQFRFCLEGDKVRIWIDYYNAEDQKQLITALTGRLTTLSKQSLTKAFWTHPLVTLKAIMLIHWQALKLLKKGIAYITKPVQKPERLTTTAELKKKGA